MLAVTPKNNPEFGSMLESLVRLIEHQSSSMRCSILLLDDEGVALHHGAAPSLPGHYCRAIDGLKIGPGVGSCGTAAFTKETTIVSDIANHEYWAPFRALALPIGLRACWSTPIMASTGQCLGTFAMYYDEPREPARADLDLIRTAALLAGALIERERLHETTAAHSRALGEANETLEEQQVELEIANQNLQDSAAELEMLNEQLQQNATELEMQAEELELTNVELRASEERMRDIFQQAPVALAVLRGPDHVFTMATPTYLATLGGEIIGRPASEVVSSHGRPYLDLLHQVYTTGQPFRADEQSVMLDRDGDGVPEQYFFNIALTPLRDRDGKVYAIASASENVTEHVAGRLELEAARAEAVQANKAKSEFLATMSHELRTPLNAISGYADLLLADVRGAMTPAQRGDVERIKRSGQHLLGLINDILNFAKLEAGRVEFHLADTPVTPLLQSLEELVRPQIDTKTLSFSQKIAAEDLIVRADAEKVRQVLLNLVTNAVKFTDAGGHVGVDCQADDNQVRITVRDTGRGIPEEHLARIFDPFVQVERERTPKSQQGVGLGLSISRDLARGMGGSLTVSSALGQGSEFTLTLPRPAAENQPRAESETQSLLATAN